MDKYIFPSQTCFYLGGGVDGGTLIRVILHLSKYGI
jgi:hypothetical protein